MSAALARRLAGAVLLALLCGPASADPAVAGARDAVLLQAQVDALPAQRPGVVDLYTIAVAGDGHEAVFTNEVLHLRALMRSRFDAGTVLLANGPRSFDPPGLPLATVDALRDALDGVAQTMDREEDLLLLVVTSHGDPAGGVALDFAPIVGELLDPPTLRTLLAGSGIRNRVVVVSACYSGRFLPALRDDHTLAITAARADRPSFGCGAESDITYFGRAFLVNGLNAHADFRAAFDAARKEVTRRERAEDFPPSWPQMRAGKAIGPVLERWRAGLTPGPAVPYAYDTPAARPVPTAAQRGGEASSR